MLHTQKTDGQNAYDTSRPTRLHLKQAIFREFRVAYFKYTAG